MTATASLIQTLHRINRQKEDLKGQLVRGPKVAAMARQKVAQAEANVQSIREKITRAKIEADDKQLQMKSREDKISHWKGQLNIVKENREFQALKDQIAADTQANLVMSDEILETLEQLDAMEESLKDALAETEALRGDCAKVEGQVEQRREHLEAELARVEGELTEAEKLLTGDIRRDYLRLVEAKGEDAMAELEGNCCSGCYQSLTPQHIERLGMGNSVACPSCGRLLYLSRNQ